MLSPGLKVKRWFLLLVLGVVVAGLGLSFLMSALTLPAQLSTPMALLTLPFLPNWLRGGLLLAAGLGIVGAGVWQLNRNVASAFLKKEMALDNLELVDAIVQHSQRRQRRTGPKIVVIGGGTGMPTLLRGLRQYTDNLTAVVTVADDGGSSGRLRREMGVLPPGDFRNNIAALSDAEGLMTQLLQYRFAEGSGLGSHNFGNIFIAAMAAITGSFEKGIAESSRVLAVQGRILPSTLDNVVLCAEIRRRPQQRENGSPADASANADTEKPGAGNPRVGTSVPVAGQGETDEEEWRYVRGESQIPESGGRIVRVHLEPESARAYPDTIRAILNADLILAAPGSFFTSLMPNLLVPAIRQAICAAPAPRFYVCNVATQRGETDHFDVDEHMRHLRLHAGNAFTTVLANANYDPDHPPADNVQWVTLPATGPEAPPLGYRLFTGDLVDELRPWRHDPAKMAQRVMEVYTALQNESTQEPPTSSTVPSDSLSPPASAR